MFNVKCGCFTIVNKMSLFENMYKHILHSFRSALLGIELDECYSSINILMYVSLLSVLSLTLI